MAKKRRVDNAGSCFGRPPPSAAAHRLRRGGGDCSFLRCGFLVWASAAVGGGSPPSAGGRRLFFFALRGLGLGVRPQWGRLSACGGLTPRGFAASLLWGRKKRRPTDWLRRAAFADLFVRFSSAFTSNEPRCVELLQFFFCAAAFARAFFARTMASLP